MVVNDAPGAADRHETEAACSALRPYPGGHKRSTGTDGTFPSAAGHVALTTLLADMQTIPLPDVPQDLCSPAKLRYQ